MWLPCHNVQWGMARAGVGHSVDDVDDVRLAAAAAAAYKSRARAVVIFIRMHHAASSNTSCGSPVEGVDVGHRAASAAVVQRPPTFAEAQ
jgi:hypothetical protein